MQEAEDRERLNRADLDLIRAAAAEAGRIANSYFRRNPDVWMKPGESPVSEADIRVDRFLHAELTAARPDYGWLSEETADSPERLKMHRTFVVDPIDGTRAFIDGRDTWCVSIAVVENGLSVAGVLDCPTLREVFWATPGGGAFQDGARIAVRPAISEPLVGGPKTMVDKVPQPLRSRLIGTPYVPSLAYRLAMLARGSIDATFVKPNSHDWDLAAADLILREAGGRILDPEGRQPAFAGPDARHGALVAGSGDLLRTLLATLAT